MTTPVNPEGPGSGASDLPQLPPNFYAGAAGTSADDPWYKYAQQMFPNTPITPDIIAGLKRNMMSMISTTISEIKARQAEAQKYNEKVAKGEE